MKRGCRDCKRFKDCIPPPPLLDGKGYCELFEWRDERLVDLEVWIDALDLEIGIFLGEE